MSSRVELDELAVELLSGPNFAHLATMNADGSVQVHPIWVHVEDGRPVMNTAVGRVKERNIRRDPRVTLEVSAADDPYCYVEIRGTAELVDDPGGEHIEWLAHKYTGESFAGSKPGMQRVKIVVTPTHLRSSPES